MSEVRLKRQVGAAITTKPHKRTQEHLDHLSQYFIRYKFFSDLKRDNKLEVYMNVLKFLKLVKLEADENLIEQGEDGDRFYFVVKGTVKVYKAYSIPVKRLEIDDGVIRGPMDVKI